MPFAEDPRPENCRNDQYSIIIVGGGAAGIGAAVGARQADKQGRILLLESESCLGGAATHRGVVSYCGLYTCEENPRQAVGGVWDELRNMLVKVGATESEPQRHRGVFQVIDPEGLKFCLDELLEAYNIEVMLHAPVVGAERAEDDRICAVFIQERRGLRRFEAKAFVDCSGECDLAFHAGASTRYGNHGHLNLGTMSTRFGGLPRHIKPTASAWSTAILAAKTTNPDRNITKTSSVLLRLPCGDIVSYYASAQCDVRSAASISAAERYCRKQAQEYLHILRALPEHENLYLASTGHNFGTRESRHLNAVYQLTKDDLEQPRHFEDCVALGAWGMEWHEASDYSSSFGQLPHGTFEIPLRSLWSRDTPNLLAGGRCVDGDQYAGSSVRVMGTALATGQAAGTAAGILAGNEMAAENLSKFVGVVRNCLKNSGAVLDASNLKSVKTASKL